MSTWKHAANEWADTAINGLQGLKNIKDRISTVEDVLQNMEDCVKHCREVDNTVPTTPESLLIEITQILNKARCLSKRIVGNEELAKRIVDYFGTINQVPTGWKLVPVEPTEEMTEAFLGRLKIVEFLARYRAMLAAAPTLIAEPEPEGEEDVTHLAFESWWLRHGQFVRALDLDGNYEKTIAFHAWEAAIAISNALHLEAQGEPVAWVDVKDRDEGPYEFHGKELLNSGRHLLYAAVRAPATQPTVPGWTGEVTAEMIEAAESVEDLYRRGTPETWGKVFKAMLAAAKNE